MNKWKLKRVLMMTLLSLLLYTSRATAGEPVAHIMICCKFCNGGVDFLVNGQWNANHDYGDINQARDILQKIKDAGIHTVSIDMTNSAQWERLWASSLTQINNIKQVCQEKGMQFFIFIGAQLSQEDMNQYNVNNATTYWNQKAGIILNVWAGDPTYRKYGYGDDRPILIVFLPSQSYWPVYNNAPDKGNLAQFHIGTTQVNDPITFQTSDGWGYRNTSSNPEGTVRFASTNGGINPTQYYKVSAQEWSNRVAWAKQATHYSVYGGYDDTCDAIQWGIARTTNANVPYNIYTGNGSDPWVYYNIIKNQLNPPGQSPYAGVITLPGTVEAENYDNGGEGIAYHDTEAANLGGEGRSEGVDTQTSTEGTYNIGWTSTGEWTEYTVNVAATGSYTLAARMSSPAGGSFHIEMDGTNVSGTVAVPNTGGWQNWQTVTKTVNLTAGQHIMRFYIDQHVQGFNVNKFVFTTASTNGDGLTAQYFNGQNFNTSVLTRKDASINFDWANGSPAAGINSDDFSARWTGQIKPRYTGTYTFYLNTDNGRRLWINNQLIIDKWINDWGIEYTGTIALNANQLYDIKVEYFEAVGGANARMEWSSSSQAREVVPQSQLYSLASARIASDPEVSPATEASSLQFSPNPANHTVKIVWQNADKEPVTLSVENMQGQSMHREVFKGKTSYELNVAGWPQGLYLIQLQTGNAVVTKKLMVTH